MERQSSFEQELDQAVLRHNIFSFIPTRNINDIVFGGKKTEETKKYNVLRIYTPLSRRNNFNIFFDATSSYNLVPAKTVKNDKIITVGTVVDSSRLGLEKITEKTVTDKLKDFDIIPCLFPHSTSNIYPLESDNVLKNKGPILFISWELSKSYDIFKENVEDKKLESREAYKKNIVVAHFIHGQFYLLIPNQSKYLSKMTVYYFDLKDENLVSLKSKIDDGKYPASRYYNILYEKIYPMLTHFS